MVNLNLSKASGGSLSMHFNKYFPQLSVSLERNVAWTEICIWFMINAKLISNWKYFFDSPYIELLNMKMNWIQSFKQNGINMLQWYSIYNEYKLNYSNTLRVTFREKINGNLHKKWNKWTLQQKHQKIIAVG